MTALQLKELSHSGLYRRRRDRPDSLRVNGLPEEELSNMANALANTTCERCKGGFAPAEKIVNSNGELLKEESTVNMTFRCSLPLAVISVVNSSLAELSKP
ncbi:LIMS1 isoform 9 [Pongo abelii]|uniref:LIMS1 isoform 9 n=1 Tax=Pongo abelii TaxID=9601 RepID=A0A2J8QZ53_PONAB|nr:LIMS1 isoform 9 [Pongo abelii]